MLKQIIASSFIISSLVFPGAVLADHDFSDDHKQSSVEKKSAPQERKPEVRSNIQKKEDNFSPKISDRKAEITLNFQQKRTEIGKIIIERQTKHADWLDNITIRVQTKIDSLKTEGKNTTSAQTKLDSIKAQLGEIYISITSSTDILNSIDRQNVATEFPKLKDSIKSTHQKLVDTQKALRETIRELKNL